MQIEEKMGVKAELAKDVAYYISRGHEFSKEGIQDAAENCYRKALEIDPDHPMANNNLGWSSQLKGDFELALRHYRKAISQDQKLRIAHINFVNLLYTMRRVDEARNSWREFLRLYPKDRNMLNDAIGLSMRRGDLQTAGKFAKEYAAFCRGSRWNRYSMENKVPIPEKPFPNPVLTLRKLKHDIEQLNYLKENHILTSEIDDIIQRYHEVAGQMESAGLDKLDNISPVHNQLIGDYYNRLLHVRESPPVERALSESVNSVTTESEYFNHPLGLAIVDNFLTEEALKEIRLFCLESTVWCQNHYSHGRLGAFFRDGFNCPLLLQIAAELRAALPTIIGDKHKVLQIWAFKNESYQPEVRPHADFAAVNVNFWITAEDANLDKESGGLTIYDVEAPKDWDFETYNKNGDYIEAYLKERNASIINVPYKANRGIIFNSDLFHKTSPLHFKEGYQNRRINITFLFGNREDAGMGS